MILLLFNIRVLELHVSSFKAKSFQLSLQANSHRIIDDVMCILFTFTCNCMCKLDFTQDFIDNEVKLLWPKGWMPKR